MDVLKMTWWPVVVLLLVMVAADQASAHQGGWWDSIKAFFGYGPEPAAEEGPEDFYYPDMGFGYDGMGMEDMEDMDMEGMQAGAYHGDF